MEEGQTAAGYKKETAFFIAIAALVIGFLGGIVFSIYKSPATSPQVAGQPQAPQGQQAAEGGMSPADMAAHILEVERQAAADPGNVEIWIHLGNDYLSVNQYKKAIGAYTKALELSPDNVSVITDLGVAHRRNGQIDKAIELFDKAAQLDPKHEQSRFNKGVTLISDLNDLEGAVKVWEEVLRINPLAQAPNGQSVEEIVEMVKADITKKKAAKQ